MHDQVAELVRQGRKLPPIERERLVNELLESLNEPAAGALDGAWELEIAKRLAEYDRGEVEAIDADIVFAKARRLAGE
jgi:putative addiction module component (TIGR02574 family)